MSLRWHFRLSLFREIHLMEMSTRRFCSRVDRLKRNISSLLLVIFTLGFMLLLEFVHDGGWSCVCSLVILCSHELSCGHSGICSRSFLLFTRFLAYCMRLSMISIPRDALPNWPWHGTLSFSKIAQFFIVRYAIFFFLFFAKRKRHLNTWCHVQHGTIETYGPSRLPREFCVIWSVWYVT